MPKGFEKYRVKDETVSRHYDAVLQCLRSSPIPIMSNQLENRFNIQGTVIRAIVSKARRNKEPLCSSPKGYWLTNDPDELEKNADSMAERASSIMAAVSGMRGAAFKLRVNVSTQYDLF